MKERDRIPQEDIATQADRPAFGPWRDDLSEIERVARLRELRAIAALLLGRGHPLAQALRRAESDLIASETAWILLQRLPPLPQRKVLCAYARIGSPA